MCSYLSKSIQKKVLIELNILSIWSPVNHYYGRIIMGCIGFVIRDILAADALLRNHSSAILSHGTISETKNADEWLVFFTISKVTLSNSKGGGC